jgi:hypothetical protein
VEAAHAGVVVAGNGIGVLGGGLCSACSRYRCTIDRSGISCVNHHYLQQFVVVTDHVDSAYDNDGTG